VTAITGIRLVERSNRPCELILPAARWTRALKTATRILARYELDRCHKAKPLSTAIDPNAVGFDDYEKVFIRALRVAGARQFPDHADRVRVLGEGDQRAEGPTAWVAQGSEGVTPLPVGDEQQEPNRPGEPSGPWSGGWTGWRAAPMVSS
jgi:hypothetical protein